MSERVQYFFSDVAEFKKGINYSSSDYVEENNGIPFISIKCLLKGGGFDFDGIKFLRDRFENADKLKTGELLFSITDLTRAGDIVGSPMLVPEKYNYSIASMDLIRVKPNEQFINTEFLYHLMMTNEIRSYFVNHSAGSTVLHLEVASIPKLQFELPPLSTQRKIARILSTADAVIEKTQAAIAKYKAIKQGMLQDLFTRGIDPATNKLRPTYKDAPHLYKESKLGWIPKEWEVDTIENISKRIWIGLVTTMTTHYVENGIPLIRNNNIRNNMIEKEEMIKLDVVFSESNSQRYLHKGDIVTVHTGDIGTSAIIDDTLDPSHGFATINTTVDSVKIINLYLCFYFNWNEFKTRIEVYATGDGRSNLNLYDFLYIPTAYPKDLFEQNLIIERLNSMNQKLQTEQTYLHKLQQIKAGLMADLLSGKKSVTVDEEPSN